MQGNTNRNSSNGNDNCNNKNNKNNHKATTARNLRENNHTQLGI